MPIRAPAVLLALVAGCALTHRPADQAPKIETMLAAAGFQAILADTPEKLDHLKSLRPYTLTYSTRRGKPHYWYADPSGCQCLYVGTEAAYRRYDQLAIQRDLAKSAKAAATMDADAAAVDQHMDYFLEPYGPFLRP